MQKNKISILSTGDLSPAISGLIQENGVLLDAIAFTRINALTDATEKIIGLADKKLDVVFTSGNAVSAVTKMLRSKIPDWSVYTIAGNTWRAAEEYFGKKSIMAIADDASSLADVIVGKKIPQVIFFCGNLRRDELPSKLREEGILVEEYKVYETMLTPQLLTRSYDGILFFSPGAVESFFSVNTLTTATKLFAIGNTTAKAIKTFSDQEVIVASRADKDLLIREAIQYFESKAIK